MRRLLAASGVATLVALAACGGDDRGVDEATAAACREAEETRSIQIERFYNNVGALDEATLGEEKYEQAALEHLEDTVLAWSQDLQAQASTVEDPRLVTALTELSDGLSEAATDLSEADPENPPNLEELEPLGKALAEICYPNGS